MDPRYNFEDDLLDVIDGPPVMVAAADLTMGNGEGHAGTAGANMAS